MATYGYRIHTTQFDNYGAVIAEDWGYEKYSYAKTAAYTKMNYADPSKYYVEVTTDPNGVFGTTTGPPAPPDEGVGGDRGGGDSGRPDTKDKISAALEGEGADWQTWAAIATVASVIIMIIVLVLTRGKSSA